MHYRALAIDYDGTLARDSHPDCRTLAALRRLRATGRRTILVTGRILSDLETVLPDLTIFDRVVAENGAVLLRPDTGEVRALGPSYPPELVDALRRRGAPVTTGASIVATWQPHEGAAIDVIRDLGLEYQVVFNKGAVMLLPSGHNKATGLEAALHDLDLSYRNTVGIGDAENDHSFLALCELSVCVQNALPSLRAEVDVVTRGDHGDGVQELVEQIVTDDLREWSRDSHRSTILLGTDDTGGDCGLPSIGEVVMIAGPSQSGKSTLVTGLLEALTHRGYQCCVVDPEGDYDEYECGQRVAVTDVAPTEGFLGDLLKGSDSTLTMNLLDVRPEERPARLSQLLRDAFQSRIQTGRPHWIIIDEAHHMLWPPLIPEAKEIIGSSFENVVLVTVHPSHMAPEVLRSVTALVVTGSDPARSVEEFCSALGIQQPVVPDRATPHDFLLWRPGGGPPVTVHTSLFGRRHRRHRRKYMEGDLGSASFFFRGPRNEMNQCARNLKQFVEMSETIAPEVWAFHLKQGDFERWFRTTLRDDTLGDYAHRVASDSRLSPAESFHIVAALINERYGPPT